MRRHFIGWQPNKYINEQEESVNGKHVGNSGFSFKQADYEKLMVYFV